MQSVYRDQHFYVDPPSLFGRPQSPGHYNVKSPLANLTFPPANQLRNQEAILSPTLPPANQLRNQEATLPLPSYNLFGLSVKKPRSYSAPPLSKPFWPISGETKKLLCPSPLKTFLAYQWRDQEATLPLPPHNSCKPTNITHSKVALPFPSPPKTFVISNKEPRYCSACPSPLKTFLSYQREGSMLPYPLPPSHNLFMSSNRINIKKIPGNTPLNLKWQ